MIPIRKNDSKSTNGKNNYIINGDHPTNEYNTNDFQGESNSQINKSKKVKSNIKINKSNPKMNTSRYVIDTN